MVFYPEIFKNDLTGVPWKISDVADHIDNQAGYWTSPMTELSDQLPTKQMRVNENDIPYTTNEWKKPKGNKEKNYKLKVLERKKAADDWQRVKE